MTSDAVTLVQCTSPQTQPPRYPFPPYPTGWFQVAYSDEIKPGEVKPLVYFGKQLVTFRTESGRLSVLDAVCPHMRAHIGLGGKVKGESVVCPSHGWQFGVDGRLHRASYLQKIPPRSSLACWPVREKNGLVIVWHDIEKKPPSWTVPHIPEFSSDEWIAPMRREWKIRSSNHEVSRESGRQGAHQLPAGYCPSRSSSSTATRSTLRHPRRCRRPWAKSRVKSSRSR